MLWCVECIKCDLTATVTIHDKSLVAKAKMYIVFMIQIAKKKMEVCEHNVKWNYTMFLRAQNTLSEWCSRDKALKDDVHCNERVGKYKAKHKGKNVHHHMHPVCQRVVFSNVLRNLQQCYSAFNMECECCTSLPPVLRWSVVPSMLKGVD